MCVFLQKHCFQVDFVNKTRKKETLADFIRQETVSKRGNPSPPYWNYSVTRVLDPSPWCVQRGIDPLKVTSSLPQGFKCFTGIIICDKFMEEKTRGWKIVIPHISGTDQRTWSPESYFTKLIRREHSYAPAVALQIADNIVVWSIWCYCFYSLKCHVLKILSL